MLLSLSPKERGNRTLVQVIYGVTGAAVLISVLVDKEKTVKALNVTKKKLFRILPAFLEMLILESLLLSIVSEEFIVRYVGGGGFIPTLTAAVVGTLTMMPGFVVFPLCGILLQQGVAYTTLAAFSTTLMMVGVETFPIEREYLGLKAALLHNFVQGMFLALVVSLVIGIVFGEVMLW